MPTILSHLPEHTHSLGGLAHGDFVEIAHRWIPGLDLPEPPLHAVAVFQLPCGDGLLQLLQSCFHTGTETLPDGLLFFSTTCRAAQNVSLFALRNGNLLDLH